MNPNSPVDEAQAARAALAYQPADLDLETAVLGSIMVYGRYSTELQLKLEYFIGRQHRIIFEACHSLHARGVPPLPHTVLAALAGMEDEVGGLGYLQYLVEGTPVDVNLQAYARMLEEGYVRRRVLKLQTTDYLTSTVDVVKVLDQLHADLAAIPRPSDTATVFDAQEAISLLMESRTDRSRNIHVGIPHLDTMLRGGLSPGELTTLAGRPGQGKTTMALCWARAALEQGKSVGVLSFEMSAAEVVARIIAADTLIPADRVVDAYHGEMGDPAQSRVANAFGAFDGFKDSFVIDQLASMTAEKIRARVAEWGHRNLDMLVVDHLQLTTGDEAESRVNQLDRVTRELKGIAKEQGIAILACSQLNRQGAQRGSGNSKPELSDLRDSGAIEQNSDVVLMLHRPEAKDAVKDPDLPVKVELLIRKNRNGGVGSTGMSFWRHHSRFTAPEPNQEYGQW